MLTIVIEKPIHITSVIAEPRISSGAFRATSAENCGESAATVMPQNIIKIKNNQNGKFHTNGDRRQHKPEPISAYFATDALPKRKDNLPPITHPKPPDAMIINASSEGLIFISCRV